MKEQDTLVLIEKENKIILERQEDVLEALDASNEGKLWQSLTAYGLAKVWKDEPEGLWEQLL